MVQPFLWNLAMFSDDFSLDSLMYLEMLVVSHRLNLGLFVFLFVFRFFKVNLKSSDALIIKATLQWKGWRCRSLLIVIAIITVSSEEGVDIELHFS